MMFDVNDSMTVTDIKELVAEKAEVPVEKQRLLYKGKQIEEGTLHDWGMNKDDKVELVLRLRAGAKRAKGEQHDTESKGTKRDKVEIATDAVNTTFLKLENPGRDGFGVAVDPVVQAVRVKNEMAAGGMSAFMRRVSGASVSDLESVYDLAGSTDGHKKKFKILTSCLFSAELETYDAQQKGFALGQKAMEDITVKFVMESDFTNGEGGVSWAAIAQVAKTAKDKKVLEQGIDGVGD